MTRWGKFMSGRFWRFGLSGLPWLALLIIASAARTPEPAEAVSKPAATNADEPFAPKLSLARSAEYLDGVTMAWLREKNCASCHTSYPYLLARPMLGDPKAPALVRMRKFLEERVANWDRGGPGKG